MSTLEDNLTHDKDIRQAVKKIAITAEKTGLNRFDFQIGLEDIKTKKQRGFEVIILIQESKLLSAAMANEKS